MSIIVQRYDAAHLTGSAIEVTPQGLRAPARFTRSGVLEYDLPDGTVRREWRPPDEVFALESYSTLWDVPITIHHPDEGEVDGDNYRRETVGHVSADVAPEDNEFLRGTAVIRDDSAVRMAQGKHLTEFSAGYLSLLDPTPGIVPAGMPDAGKTYDVIQRRIRYNHVAFLPPGTGRAGPEVAIRLDSRGNQIGPLTPKDKPMELTPEELANLKSLAAVAPKLIALTAAPTVTPAPAPAAPAPAVVTDTGALGATGPTEEEEKREDSEEEEKKDSEEEKKNDARTQALIERRVNDSLELREQARTVLGPDAVLTGKSNRDIMIEVVKHVDSKFALGNRDETYLRARFDGAIQHHADKQSLQQHMALRTMRNDAADSTPVTHVDSLQEKISNAWQTK